MARPSAATIVVAASAIASAVLIALIAWPAARFDFFFDEMWRAQQIRSSNPVSAYLDGDTAIPPGWIVSLWGVFEIVPSRRPLLRAVAAAFGIVAACLLALALFAVLRRSRDLPTLPGRDGSSIVAAAAVAVFGAWGAIASSEIAAHAVYLNNYLADVAVGAAIVLAVVEIDTGGRHDRAAWGAIAVLAVLAPWLAQGALFTAPMAAVILWRHRADAPGRARFSAIAFPVSAFVVWAWFLRPVNDNGAIDEFWRPDTPEAGVGDYLRRLRETFVDAAYPAWIGDRTVVLVVALAATAVGLAVLQRAWRWWLPLYVSAHLLTIVAAVAVGWPATFVRVNTGFLQLVLVAAPVGAGVVLVRAGAAAASRVGHAAAGLVPLALVAALLVFAWWPREVVDRSDDPMAFARGLSEDLRIVAERAAPGDLVIAYHLSNPYVRDRVLNDDAVAPGVRVVDEMSDPDRVYDDIDGYVEDDTTGIWCVIPYEAGPDATFAACLPDTGWVEAERSNTVRAVIIRLAPG